MRVVHRRDAAAHQLHAHGQQFGVVEMHQRRPQAQHRVERAARLQVHARDAAGRRRADVDNAHALDERVAQAIADDLHDLVARLRQRHAFLVEDADVVARVHGGEVDDAGQGWGWGHGHGSRS